MKAQEIITRYNAEKSEKKTVESTLQLIEEFIRPFSGKFFQEQGTEYEVDWRKREVWDGTAILAAQTLSASMQGSLTSPSAPWFGLTFLQDELKQNTDAMAWLEACVEIMYDALHDSNFDVEASEFYLDLVTFGTAVIVEEAKSEATWAGIDFSTVPMREIFFEHDHKKRLVRLYRRLMWNALQLKEKFGLEALPDYIKQKLEAGAQAQERMEVVFCVYERDNVGPFDMSKPIPPEKRPWGYKYVMHKDATQIGPEGGYYEMPAFVSRWRKTSGSKWGFSPAHVALSDVLTLNELVATMMEALAKVVDPATLTTNRGLLSDLDQERGGLTVVRSLEDVRIHESGARFDVSNLERAQLQESINRMFHVDQLQLKESPAMTATEVSVRYELMQRLLGPTLGRLQTDFLDPVVSRTFNLCRRAQLFPPMPPVVSELQGRMQVQYTGPLPRAQRMDEVRSTQDWLATLAGMAEVAPDIMDVPDTDAIARGLGDMMNVPAKFRHSKSEVADERAARREQQARMEEAMQRQAEGEAAQAEGQGVVALAEAGSAA